MNGDIDVIKQSKYGCSMQGESEELANLRRLSSWIGSRISMVQGPGGNTSLKNSEFMWIKGSGTKLKDAEIAEIFVRIDLATGEPNPLTQDLQASIETNLHQLSKFAVVVHTHSTAAIAAGFRDDVEDVATAFGRTSVVPYHRPGTSLADGIRNFVDTSIHDYAILKNHGLLVWGSTVEEVKQRIEAFEKVFTELLEYSETDLIEARSLLRRGNLKRYLTPDHAVFLDSSTLKDIEGGQIEPNWLAQMYEQLCIALASSLHFRNLSWLDEDEVRALQNWDIEKLRKEANS